MIENASIYIDAQQIKKNTQILRNKLHKDSKIIAVIKANGYGCDLVQSALLFQAMKIDVLAVLSIDQAIEMRNQGVTIPILLLGVSLKSNFKYLLEYDVIQMIPDLKYAQELSDYGSKHDSKIKVHLKVDTGLNRLGFKNYLNIKRAYDLSGLDILGIYSHFVNSQSYEESDLKFSKLQIKRFNTVLKQLTHDKIDLGMTHLQNSPSILNFGDLAYSAVRCGMVLFGLFHPSQLKEALDYGFKPVIEMRGRISMIKTLEKGEYVGYGRQFQAEDTMEIATISSGYVDVDMKSLSLNGGSVVYKDELSPILGDIAMSQFMIDVTDLDAAVEDEVIIFGHPKQTIDDFIKITDQSINELISHLRYTMPRIYLK